MEIANLASLPTDSLYKFMALTGILILISVMVFNEIFRKSYQFKLFETKKNIDIERHKLIALGRKIDGVSRELKEVQEKNNSIVEEDADAVNKQKSAVEQLKKTVEELGEKQELRHELTCELEYAVSQIEYLSKRLKIVKIIYWIGIIVGMLLSILGFYFWYVKLQIFVDAAIQVRQVVP